MRAPRLAMAAVLLCAACATVSGLDRSKPTGGKPVADATVDEVPVLGQEATVELTARTLVGELLAVDEDHLWLSVEGRVIPVLRPDVKRVSIELYPSGVAHTAAWAGLGAGSTLTHGLLLIFSAPIWFAVGGGTVNAAAVSNDEEVALLDLDKLHQFARYPQGMPADRRNCPCHPAQLAPPSVPAL